MKNNSLLILIVCMVLVLLFMPDLCFSDKHFEINDLKVVSSNNFGEFAEVVNVGVEMSISAYMEDIVGFDVRYPKNEIASYIRDMMNEDINSVKKMLDPKLKEEDSSKKNRENRKCIIELFPKFEHKLEFLKTQKKTLKFSIPSIYFQYVDFFIMVKGEIMAIGCQSDFRTLVFSIPKEDNAIIDFNGDIFERKCEGCLNATIYKPGERARLWRELYHKK